MMVSFDSLVQRGVIIGPTRTRVLVAVMLGERTTRGIARRVGIGTAVAHRHQQALIREGLITLAPARSGKAQHGALQSNVGIVRAGLDG